VSAERGGHTSCSIFYSQPFNETKSLEHGVQDASFQFLGVFCAALQCLVCTRCGLMRINYSIRMYGI